MEKLLNNSVISTQSDKTVTTEESIKRTKEGIIVTTIVKIVTTTTKLYSYDPIDIINKLDEHLPLYQNVHRPHSSNRYAGETESNTTINNFAERRNRLSINQLAKLISYILPKQQENFIESINQYRGNPKHNGGNDILVVPKNLYETCIPKNRDKKLFGIPFPILEKCLHNFGWQINQCQIENIRNNLQDIFLMCVQIKGVKNM